MHRMGMVRSGSVFAALLIGVGLLAGCGDDGGQTFMEIQPQIRGVVDLDDVEMEGGDDIAFVFVIESDMISPEVRAKWTVQNREIFIDMYLMRQSDYDPELSPPEQTNIFWTSVPDIGPEFGERRVSSITLHPCVYNDADPPACRPEGAWVVLFHNALLKTPANRTFVSLTVNLRYFQ